jgi:hypothetical protein
MHFYKLFSRLHIFQLQIRVSVRLFPPLNSGEVTQENYLFGSVNYMGRIRLSGES